jgi:hypothetical protein
LLFIIISDKIIIKFILIISIKIYISKYDP